MNALPILSFLTLLPIFGGIVILGLQNQRWARGFAFGFSFLSLVLALGLWKSFDAASGALQFTERLDPLPNVYASPVAADGRIYVVGREGGAVVLEAGPRLKLLATNHLDDGFDASPAIVDGEMYLRGRRHLYRISSS